MEIEKEWRAIRIAANIIYKSIPNVLLENTNNVLFDLLATYNDGLRFGIKIASQEYVRSDRFNQYFETLKQEIANIPQLPIILMCVDESKETASFGFLVTLDFYTPTINENPKLVRFNTRNITKLKDNLDAMAKISKAISTESISIRKDISVTKTVKNGIPCNVKFVYIRDFTNEYKMSEPKIENDEQSFNRYLHGIPQEEYPHDRLDDIIFQTIKEKYYNAKVKSYTIVTNSELAALRRLDSKPSTTCTILIEPDIKELAELRDYISIFKYRVKAYPSNPRNIDKWEGLTIRKMISKDSWGELKKELLKASNTIHLPEDIAL